LSIQLTAPGRNLEIEGLEGDKAISLARQENPIGLHRFTIDRADVLKVDEHGGLTLGINISDRSAAAADPRVSSGAENIWKIEFINLEVHGKIPSR
jgi:hypothetical protein